MFPSVILETKRINIHSNIVSLSHHNIPLPRISTPPPSSKKSLHLPILPPRKENKNPRIKKYIPERSQYFLLFHHPSSRNSPPGFSRGITFPLSLSLSFSYDKPSSIYSFLRAHLHFHLSPREKGRSHATDTRATRADLYTRTAVNPASRILWTARARGSFNGLAGGGSSSSSSFYDTAL